MFRTPSRSGIPTQLLAPFRYRAGSRPSHPQRSQNTHKILSILERRTIHSCAVLASIMVLQGIDPSDETPVVPGAIGPYAPIEMNDKTKITWIADRLIETYGAPTGRLHDPIENLVLTILSQNTNDTNRDRAFKSLMKRFKTLEDVRVASLGDIASAIQIGGLQQQKARSIREALNRIVKTRGYLDLEFLNDLAPHDALRWLLELPGVGPKTAGIVMLFSFDRPIFPADTHIRRVMSRMGLVPERGDPHPQLNQLLPADSLLMRRLHLLTIRLGREICHPRKPECVKCPLRCECVWTRSHDSEHEDVVTSLSDKGGIHL